MSKFTKRGVALPSMKEPAASRSIVNIAELNQVFVPLISGDGSVCRPAVGTYETVIRGDALGLPEQDDGCPVAAPVTGVLSDLREMTHPILGDITCAVLDCMVSEGATSKKKSVSNLSSTDILKIANNAGIVDELDGMPLANKMAEWQQNRATLLVADGSEQEPYSSSAWAVLTECVEQVRDGLALAARAIEADAFHIAVRLPYKRRQELSKRLEEKQLYAVRGRYPAAVAPSLRETTVLRIGVQACLALYRAAAYGEKQCDCVVTVAGDAVSNPQNVRVPVGTLVEDLLHFCGLSANPQHIILGDALTGTTVLQTDISIVPGITCILAVTTRPQPKTRTCIGCGRCVHACHADLLPFEIMRRLDNMHYERLSSLLPEQCDGCGACSHVCPAGLDVTAKVLEARDAHGTIFLNWGDGDDL